MLFMPTASAHRTPLEAIAFSRSINCARRGYFGRIQSPVMVGCVRLSKRGISAIGDSNCRSYRAFNEGQGFLRRSCSDEVTVATDVISGWLNQIARLNR